MAKSIAVLVVIAVLIGVWSFSTYAYINDTVEEFTERLDRLMENPDKNEMEQMNKDWEKEKRRLMFIMNHRDVEQVSEAMLRGESELSLGRIDMALKEIKVAKFMLEELIEREKFSLENLL